MALEGLQAVQARIVDIQRRMSVAAPAAAPEQFDSVLASALGGSESGTMRAATVTAPGGYGRLTPPPELARYGNGQIPAAALTPIGHGSHRLYAPAAAAFKRMSADAATAGVRIGVTDSYRSYEAQVDVAQRKGLHKHGGLAATPGTSNHGWGLSLDLDLDGRAQAWMRANGHRYGFVEDVPREPWHWTYRAGS